MQDPDLVHRGKITSGSQMRAPVLITTPFPTPEEVAKLLGIPRKDVTRLKALVDEWVSNPETIRKFGEPTGRANSNGKRKKPAAKSGSRENGRS